MEMISRVEPFDRVIIFLEVIGLHGFGCFKTARHFTEFDTSVIYRVLIVFVFAHFCCKICMI